MLPQPLSADCGLDIEKLNYELDLVKTSAFVNSNGAFYGPLMCGMDFVWTRDIETAATDGINVYWNPDWFLSLPVPTRKTVLMHELMHPAGFHFLRRGDRDPEDWNFACDIDINNNLERDGYTFDGTTPWKDQSFYGTAVEDIYDAIHQKKIDPQCAPWGPGSDPTDMIDNPSKEVVQAAINNVVQAAHSAVANGDPGAVPGTTQQLIKKFLTPIVPWEVLLSRFFQELSQEDFSWKRPNRRFPDIYLPSRLGEERLTHIIFYEDVSGSISDADCLRFNSEVKHIKERYNPEKLTLVQFDTRITSEKTLLEHEPFDEVVIVGRGGTDLVPVREHILKHKPTAAVIFSDLYVEPMEPVKIPVIWVTIGNRAARVNFGKVIHINNE